MQCITNSVYISYLLRNWITKAGPEIPFQSHRYLNTILFSDVQTDYTKVEKFVTKYIPSKNLYSKNQNSRIRKKIFKQNKNNNNGWKNVFWNSAAYSELYNNNTVLQTAKNPHEQYSLRQFCFLKTTLTLDVIRNFFFSTQTCFV